MSLSASELYAISLTERICSAISLSGTSVIIISFLSRRSFRKPINRLVFYATFGNIMANVATLISQNGIHAGTNSNLCQIQAFLIQWFMPADALWTFAMALNVHLTFFQKYNSNQLRQLEWKYVVFCYGIAFIPAFILFFIKTVHRGKVYGSAILWCWISPTWDFLRIVLFYGPVWFVIVLTLAIYIRIGILIWRRREQLRQAGALDTTLDVQSYDPTFQKVTEISITREPNIPPAVIRPSFDDEGPSYIQEECYNPYSVSIEGGDIPHPTNVHLQSIQSNRAIENSSQQNLRTDPELEQQTSGRSRRHGSVTAEVNAAAWAYTKYAMLFFVALIVTWVPSTINRVYALIRPDNPSFGLNFASSFVLPLQGFWNSLIYIMISWPAFRTVYTDFRSGKLDPPWHAFHHRAGHSDFNTPRRTSSGHDSTQGLTV